MAAAALLACGETQSLAAIIKDVDRKFPVGLYCPVESRPEAGGNLPFVAPASTIRLTFSGSNQDAFGNWNAFRVDNVAVVLQSVFDANQVSPSPNFEDCYDPSIPPGHTAGGTPNAPSYDFNAASTPEVYLDLFPSGISGWSGTRHYFDAASTAPTAPANGTGATGGSLGLGLESDGAAPVSASRIVSGLTPGQSYVVTFWWYALSTGRLTVTIGVPCTDGDGDGFVLCGGGCDLVAGQTCGDCNDGNAHCGSSCTDADGDGWCVGVDCDESAATCTADCATDTDADLLADCRDGCLDSDGDGYGTAGGLGSFCLGADCAPTNRWCHATCVDADGDGRCAGVDCQDGNPNVGTELPEVNDFLDQNCPGDDGYGVVDEVSGTTGFLTPGSKAVYSWPHQTGASNYLAVRSSSRTFSGGCNSALTSGNSTSFLGNPAPGQVFYHLVRPESPSKGSWGQRSGGVERAFVCGAESDCDNAVDDDGDASTDCADPDCSGTAACRAQTFTFEDTEGDDITDTALQQFLQGATAGAGDHLFFEIVVDATRTVAWCSQNAGFYRTQYLSLAPTQGSVSSGSWQKWRKAPATGNAWVGPDTSSHLNTFGNDCFGPYTWCSEQWSPEPQNAIFPDRTNDCEVYDFATGACRAGTGSGTWRLTIKIASTRAAACGF